ncbi:MAG: acyl-CoA dehydratase activase [Chloroflexales bacterium]
MQERFLGIDIGSTTVKVVLADMDGQIVAHRYLRSNGQPRTMLISALRGLAAAADMGRVTSVGLTGSGGEAIASVIGCRHVNELVAQTRAVGTRHPTARTVIEIGGQDSKLLILDWDAAVGRMRLVDFAMNSLCAAGTGSFLDQQAERLGIDIEDAFARIALQSTSAARIAGRCTVFAKSDMIHLQQKGTLLPDILAGLCLALARNFTSVVAKGKVFTPPILFQGGVAYNLAVVRAFETVLGLGQGELIVPAQHEVMAALGAALIAGDDAAFGRRISLIGLDRLEHDLIVSQQSDRHMPALRHPRPARPAPIVAPAADTAPTPVYLGIDVGSMSTNIVLIDAAGQVVARRYMLTAGNPLDAVRRGLAEIGQEVSGRIAVIGVGTTGSGRHLTADFVGGDIVRNEIAAQARAAVAIDPTVETIFEIGGQDSKYIRINHGAVVDFAMNNACAAGTGSFLEEQADRLNISIKHDFSRLALAAERPACLGERCTVFMESDVVHHQQQGASLETLTGGLAYAVAQNYLNRVVNGRPIGERIFFQGGVAWNSATVSAFESLTGRHITVPPHHDVTGAIGAALLAKEELSERRAQGDPAPTHFRGFDLTDLHYETNTFECRACPNLCAVNKVVIANEPPIFYGALCDKFEDVGRRHPHAHGLPDLFAERHRLLMGEYVAPEGRRNGRVRVGIPQMLLFYDMFPYWRAFIESLGMDVVISDATNPTIVSRSLEHSTAETCFPAKLAYGHILNLLDKDVDLVLLPSVMNRDHIPHGQRESNYCPYIPAISYMVAAQIDLQKRPWRPVLGALRFMDPRFKQFDLGQIATQLGVSPKAIRGADLAGAAAQEGFYAAVCERGRAALAHLRPGQPAAVIVGHPYNTHDLRVCQDLPFKLRKLGVLPIPIDYLPLDTVDISAHFPEMYWRSGHDILAAATIIRDDPRLHAIYVTNFGCGPDSFLVSYFQKLLGAQPFLELELDEHSADAGVITRCEAFFDSLRMRPQAVSIAVGEV